MQRRTVNLDDDTDARVPYDEHTSKSAALEHYISQGLDVDELLEELGVESVDEAARLQERVDGLESEVESERARADDLRRQLSEANKRNDEVTELVEYVEAEKSLQERRQERDSAPVWKRAKWWVTGYPTDEE